MEVNCWRDVVCTYCSKTGHPEEHCRRKKKEQATISSVQVFSVAADPAAVRLSRYVASRSGA